MTSSGTQLSDMTVSVTLPDGAYVPFVVETNVGGLLTTRNYRYNAGLYLAKYSALAADDGSDLIGYIYTSPLATATTVEAQLRRLPQTLENEGVSGAGTGNQATKIQSLIDDYTADGGGELRGTVGATYRCTAGIVLKDNVILDLNGATLLFVLSGTNDQAVKLRNNAHIRNGTITVQSSGASVSAQSGVHAPICIGPIYGDGGTVASPSDDMFVTGWSIRNMTLSSNKYVEDDDGKMVGAAGIQLMGGVNGGIIDQITFPDSDKLYIGIAADWNHLGTLSTTATAVAQNANKTAYNNGTAYQTYPNNITISNITLGEMTALNDSTHIGSFGIRLSGVYNIAVRQVSAKELTAYGFFHTAGDLGAEFAPADERPLVCQAVTLDGQTVLVNGNGALFQVDTYADNVATAVGLGYVSLTNPLVAGSITISNIAGTGGGGASATYGGRIIRANGVTVTASKATAYKQGLNIDEYARNVTVQGNDFSSNREDGIKVDHSGNDPQDILIDNNVNHDNGSSGSTYAGIYVGHSLRVKVTNNKVGKDGASDSAQAFGIRCTANASGVEVIGNTVLSTLASTGIAYSMMGGTDFNILRLFSDNQWVAANTAIPYGGVTCIPVAKDTTEDDRTITTYVMDKSVTPTGISLANGDIIRISDPAPGGVGGFNCVTGGTVGTDAVLAAYPAGGYCAVADLPAASDLLKGLRSLVTDANSTTFLAAAANGGANIVPVVCIGSGGWKIG